MVANSPGYMVAQPSQPRLYSHVQSYPVQQQVVAPPSPLSSDYDDDYEDDDFDESDPGSLFTERK